MLKVAMKTRSKPKPKRGEGVERDSGVFELPATARVTRRGSTRVDREQLPVDVPPRSRRSLHD
jgi:hypothetical protein